jgi:hypothetical protein
MRSLTEWKSMSKVEHYKRDMTNKKHSQRNYFFCYSPHMAFFLVEVKKLWYITEAQRVTDGKRFFLFERNERLKAALTEYHENIKGKVTFEDLEKMAIG